jgi:hypothetical protein
MQHAKLSPSSSSRWLTCTASVEASKAYENKGNAASQWGTACHALGELSLKGQQIDCIKNIEGVDVDKEMIDTAEEYADYCRALMPPSSVVLIEERFDLSFIAPDTFGTGDFSVLNDKHLHIVDLKTGHGIVHAKENTQLMLYALGAIHELEDIFDIETVTLHIAQGRANHYDMWETTYEELMEFQDFAKEQAGRILSGDTTFSPEKKACQWCPHQHNCEALRIHVDNIVTGDFDDLEELEGNADKVSTDHMKKILDNADLILGFVKAVQQVALERMEAGEKIDGYKLVESKTNRKWADESEVEKLLKGKDIYGEPKLKPMTKLLKEFGKEFELEELLVKPEGKPTIAPESDKRPEIGAVCEDFDDLS